MDDRRFDSLAKSLASGASRRSVLKGILGLGGAALAGGALLDSDTDAARRPANPTPTPVKCPGNQVPTGGACVCPATAPNKCGPDCCTSVAGGPPVPTHSECCDNECCFGTCYGEELCCATNNRSGGDLPIPPTHKIYTANGSECCEFDQECCGVDGCCDTACSDDGRCCAPEDVCPGGGESPDLCCVNNLTTASVCCDGGTNDNACFAAVAGVCCTDADCGNPCEVCNQETHICEPQCDDETQVCCTEQPGPGVCVTGECCPGVPATCEDSICCLRDGRTICTFGVTCECGCEVEADCCFINDVFIGCVDLTQDGACCTADTCGLEDPANCIVSGCFDSLCEPRSTCTTGQICCAGECVDGEVCPTPPACVNPASCAQGQPCCDGFHCCNGSCREGTDCPPG